MKRRRNPSDRNRDEQPPATASASLPAANILRWGLLGGMTALYVVRPLFPSESAAVYGDGMTVVMLWIALAVFWLLGAIGRPVFELRFGWIDAAVLLLVAWCGVSAISVMWHGAPRPAINMFWEWLGLGLAFLLARQFIATAMEARAVAAVMIAVAVSLAGYGLYQRVYEMPNSRAMYEADPDRAMRDAGLWFEPGSPERILFESRLGNREPMATFALTNSLAAFLSPWLVILFGMILDSRHNRRRLIALLLCAVPIVICLVLTKSRSGYIAVAIGLVAVWFLSRRDKLHIGWRLPAAIGLAMVVGVAGLSMSGLGGDLLQRATRSFGFRVHYWRSSVKMIADHPIVGCGPGNFQNSYTQYKLIEASEEVADPHNFLLEIWATAGTPALLAFLAVLFGFAWSSSSNTVGQVSNLPESNLSSTPGSAHLQVVPGNTDDVSCPPLYVMAGGLCGFLLAAPIGLLSAAPPGIASLLLGIPLAIATLGLLWNWVQDGQLPRWLPALGVVTVLIDLLTTGGIAFPSVAGSLWLLMALGLQGRRPRGSHPTVAWGALAVAIALAVACYCSAYGPVLGCQAEMRLAEREPLRAVEHLEAATVSDPWAVDPWRQLAAVELERWWQRPNPEDFARFEHARAKALELAPNSASLWLTAGDWSARAYSKTGPDGKRFAPQAGASAIEAYDRAVQLYQNSTLYRAKLANAYRAVGDWSGFRREAKTALEMDDLTSYSDKKLPAAVRDRLVADLKDAP